MTARNRSGKRTVIKTIKLAEAEEADALAVAETLGVTFSELVRQGLAEKLDRLRAGRATFPMCEAWTPTPSAPAASSE